MKRTGTGSHAEAWRVFSALEAGPVSAAALAARFGVHQRTASRWVRAARAMPGVRVEKRRNAGAPEYWLRVTHRPGDRYELRDDGDGNGWRRAWALMVTLRREALTAREIAVMLGVCARSGCRYAERLHSHFGPRLRAESATHRGVNPNAWAYRLQGTL